MSTRPKLTIAIPSFNRSSHLRRLLASVAENIEFAQAKDVVDVLVCDNHSADDTPATVEEFSDRLSITYIRNDRNIGSTNNIIKCFAKSKADYTWVIGDDDILTTTAIRRVLEVIDDPAGDTGLIFVNSLAIKDDNDRSVVSISGKMAMDSEQVIRQLHYRLTFLSALILRNTYDTSSLGEEYSCHLPHLELLVQSLNSYQKHVYIKDILVRGQVDNSGEFDATYVVKRPQPEITSIYVEEFLQSISTFTDSAATMHVVRKKLMFCYLFYRLASDNDVTVNPFTFTRLDEYYSAESYYSLVVKPLLRRLERRSVKKIMLMIAVIHRLRDGDGIKLVNRIKSQGRQVTKVRSERHTSILVDGNVFSDVSFGEFEVWTLGSTTQGNGFANGNIAWDMDTGSVAIGKSGLYLITWQCMYTTSLGHFG